MPVRTRVEATRVLRHDCLGQPRVHATEVGDLLESLVDPGAPVSPQGHAVGTSKMDWGGGGGGVVGSIVGRRVCA